MYWIMLKGEGLQNSQLVRIPPKPESEWHEFLSSITYNLQHPLAILLAQIITIILVARIFGWLCKKVGQPAVVGEIIAGITLGPSLLGMYFPEFSNVLFPVESLGNLGFLSQIGLILFMFVVGMELDLKVLKNKAHDAVVISHASIILPFALGMGLSYFIYDSFAPEGVTFSSFGLFMGIAMSITAFPVLARIVQERGLHKTRLGTVVITCAAADDITAWCLLAAVIAIVKAGSFVSSLYVMVLAAVYVFAMLKLVKPFLVRIANLHTSRENLSKPIVAIFFVTLLISSYTTEVLGIHALFGAFMAGAIMPENTKFRTIFIEKVEDVALVLLLPLFFVFTGLRTQIGLLNDPYLWQVTGFIILVAVIGKFVGSALAAKFVGQSWTDSLSIGALMNTRGLMELVVLNIGYELGILNEEIFAMMVIMALVTTIMTGPALNLINYFQNKSEGTIPQNISEINKFKILISFGNPERGRSLMMLSHALVKNMKERASLTAMHLSLSSEVNHYKLEEYEEESFRPLLGESKRLDQKVTTLFKVSKDFDKDIIEVANNGGYDLLLMGIGQSIFEGSLLGKILGYTTKIVNPENFFGRVKGKENFYENSPFDERTRTILVNTKIPVGIFIDKELIKLDKVFIPVFNNRDHFLLFYAQNFINSNGSQVTFYNNEDNMEREYAIREAIKLIEQNAPNHVQLSKNKSIEESFLQTQDLMIVSLENWKRLVESRSVWLAHIPSVLILTDSNTDKENDT